MDKELDSWTLFVAKQPPVNRIIYCADCINPMETVVYHNGICLVLDLVNNTVKTSTAKYLVWRYRE